MRLVWVFVLACAALSAIACGGDDDEGDGASQAAEGVFRTFLDGDFGGAWDSLHPAHQAIVARDTYINCQTGDTVPWTGVEAFREHDEIWDAPEIGQLTTRAVELRLIGDQDVTQGTLHMLQVDGEWRWFLDEDAVRAFKQGQCA